MGGGAEGATEGELPLLDPDLQAERASHPNLQPEGWMTNDRRSRKRVTVYRAEDPSQPSGAWEAEYEAIAEALHFACRDLREGRRKPLEIVEDGVQVFDAEEIASECRRQNGA